MGNPSSAVVYAGSSAGRTDSNPSSPSAVTGPDSDTASGGSSGGASAEIEGRTARSDLDEETAAAVDAAEEYARSHTPMYVYLSDVYNNSDLSRVSVSAVFLDNLIANVHHTDEEGITSDSALKPTGPSTSDERRGDSGDTSLYLTPDFTYVYKVILGVSPYEGADRISVFSADQGLPSGYMRILKLRYNLFNTKGLTSGNPVSSENAIQAYQTFGTTYTGNFSIFAPLEKMSTPTFESTPGDDNLYGASFRDRFGNDDPWGHYDFSATELIVNYSIEEANVLFSKFGGLDTGTNAEEIIENTISELANENYLTLLSEIQIPNILSQKVITKTSLQTDFDAQTQTNQTTTTPPPATGVSY